MSVPRLKRWLASLLAVLLFTTTFCPALAESLVLPAGVLLIGEGAFEGDTALDEVVLPHGIQRIESRAFADSSVSAIKLPMTLEYIAEDAFQGADVTAAVYEGTYAHEYVTENDIPYTLLGDTDYVMDVVDDENFDPHLSTESLAFTGIPEVDEQIQILRDAVDDYNNACDEVLPLLDGFDLEFSGSESDFSVTSSEYSYSIPSDVAAILSSDCEVVDFVSLDDGAVQIEVTANGEQYHIVQTFDGMSLSGARGALRSTRGSVRDNWTSLMDRLSNASEVAEYLQGKLDNVDLATDSVVMVIDGIYQYMAIAPLEDLDKFIMIRQVTDAVKDLSKFVKYLNAIDGLLSIPRKCKTVTDADRMRKELEDIRSHGHPTQQENLFSYSRDIAEIVNKKIDAAILALWSEMLCGYYEAYTAATAFRDAFRKTPKQYSPDAIVIDESHSGYFFAKWAGNLSNRLSNWGIKKAYEKAHQLYAEAVAYDRELHYDANVVIKDQDGAQVGGAEILCEDVTFTADENGLCSIEVPYSSNVLKIKKDGYRQAVKNASCTPFIPELVPVVLERLSVYGYVHDAKTNEPLAGVEVTTGEVTALTNEDGFYAMGLEEGGYTLTFTKDGYDDEERSVSVDGSEEVSVDLSPNTGKVSGYVRDPDTNQGLPRVMVTVVGGGAMQTDDNGYYEFTLKKGSYAMRFQHRKYRYKNDSVSIAGGDDIQKDAVLSKGPKGSVYGRVFAWSETDPLVGCRISNGETTVYSDSDGFYAIDLPEGDHELFFNYEIWEESYPVEIHHGDQWELEINFFMGYGDIDM